MAEAKLPEAVRERVKELYRTGYQKEEIFQLIKNEALLHLEREEDIWRCLTSLKGKAGEVTDKKPKRPRAKEFETGEFESIVKDLRSNMPGKELETSCMPIAKHVLRRCEKFTKIEEGPNYPGTPFDFFGFKNDVPYIIEMKASLHSFNYPGETQKWRLRELYKRIKGLHIALLQIAAREGKYRIFYDDQLNLLFFGPKAPFEPIEAWIREHM